MRPAAPGGSAFDVGGANDPEPARCGCSGALLVEDGPVEAETEAAPSAAAAERGESGAVPSANFLPTNPKRMSFLAPSGLKGRG